MTNYIATLPSWILFLAFLLFFGLGELLPFGPVLAMIPFFIWVYALGIASRRALSETIAMSLVKFKSALAYAAGYSLVAAFFLQAIMPYALPFHLFAIFCLFYSIFFVAKCVRSIELNRAAVLSEWIYVFFGLWFFPVGVWFIQPKIQRIVKTAGICMQE
jgi:hypothetical protein